MATAVRGADYSALAEKAVGNWQKFEAFIWYTRPDDAEDFVVVYTHNRDSGCLDQSNAAAIKKEMERFTNGDDPDVVAQTHNHSLCGWVEGYAIRVFTKKARRVTKAFKTWCDIQQRLENYPVLDEEDYSARELEACLATIKEIGRREVIDSLDDDYWPRKVYERLNVSHPDEIRGEDVLTAIGELGFFSPDCVPVEKFPTAITNVLFCKLDALSAEQKDAVLRFVLSALLDNNGCPAGQVAAVVEHLGSFGLWPQN
jgi:hypothetical protein